MARHTGEEYYVLTAKQVMFIRKQMERKEMTMLELAEKARVNSSTFVQAFRRVDANGETTISTFVYKPLIRFFHGMGKSERV